MSVKIGQQGEELFSSPSRLTRDGNSIIAETPYHELVKLISSNSVWESGTGKNSAKLKGSGSLAYGDYSVAEGAASVARGIQSHAEGVVCTAAGDRSHAEGAETTAGGYAAHSEGDHTVISTRGECAHAEGDNTVADNIAEHAEGRYNRSNHASDVFGDAGNTLHSVGIGSGSSIDQRKNAFEIMQNGDIYMKGVGGYDGTNVESAQTVQQSIGSGSPSSGMITLARDVDLTYQNTGTEADSGFEATISSSALPADYSYNPYRYNIVVVIYGSDEGNLSVYTANHFCYLCTDNGQGMMMAMCYDSIPGMDVTHLTYLQRDSSDSDFYLMYQGLSGEYRQLPEVGSKVSVYLQPLY